MVSQKIEKGSFWDTLTHKNINLSMVLYLPVAKQRVHVFQPVNMGGVQGTLGKSINY